jgi:ABC-type transport system involved in multi-copper enzyme maturation permease subunit
MLPGPVFNVELVATARRARYYFIRALYGLILLYLLWQSYAASFWWGARDRSTLSIAEISRFASTIFMTIVGAELFAVLILTPTLVAPVIADEKQRKTLHYLLASRLSSAEIVLGKLMARMLSLGVFLAIALPVISLLTLFGGVDPELVLVSFAGIASVAVFVASLSIWVSTNSRRVRDAVVGTYVLVLAWLIVPLMVESLQFMWPFGYALLGPVNRWLLASSPFSTVGLMLGPSVMRGSMDWSPLLYMLATQIGASVLLIFLSVWRLRPIFQKQGEAPARTRWFRRRRRVRLFPRPDCGDHPMIWKEMHLSRSGGLLRWSMRFLTVIGLAFMGYWVVYFTGPAIGELLVSGYKAADNWNSAREQLNYCLRTCLTILFIIFNLGAATAAASSITSEKEEDTWTSLTTTLLDGSDIVLAKLIGAFWSVRVIGAVMVLLGFLGLLTGAIHPFGAIAGLVEWAVFSWFAVALGFRFSLLSRNTTRASAATVALLIFLNGGYLMCCIPLRPDTPAILVGCTPALFTTSLMTYDEFWHLLGWSSWPHHPIPSRFSELVAANVIGLMLYGTAALGLTLASFHGFDAAIDRPKRNLWTVQPPERLKKGPGPAEL